MKMDDLVITVTGMKDAIRDSRPPVCDTITEILITKDNVKFKVRGSWYHKDQLIEKADIKMVALDHLSNQLKHVADWR